MLFSNYSGPADVIPDWFIHYMQETVARRMNLTEDDVRRIVREEMDKQRSLDGTSSAV
jgi:hypothetical protein